MRTSHALIGLVCIWFLWLSQMVWALETDQFTPPPQPLIDLGPALQNELNQAVQSAIDRTHEHYQEHLRKAAKAPFKFMRQDEARKAAACLTEESIALAVFDATVRGGYSQCEMERWARYGQFSRQPARFDPSPDQTIYGTLARPLIMVMLSPTINLYGIYLGTDKLGHFFEQGYEYYEVYRRELARGRDEAAAYRKAVELGISQENGIYGTAIDNVFSNADLAANYAGLKFYINLTHPITLGGVRYEPILVLRDNRWQFNENASRDFLRPFITEHLNEAMNPCRYNWPLRVGVRNNVRALVPRWLAFYNTTLPLEQQRLQRITKWYGENYGHGGFKNVVTIFDALAEER
ncbi:MAG: hypothetical protein ACM359_08960 [Bacillota bacterium]